MHEERLYIFLNPDTLKIKPRIGVSHSSTFKLWTRFFYRIFIRKLDLQKPRNVSRFSVAVAVVVCSRDRESGYAYNRQKRKEAIFRRRCSWGAFGFNRRGGRKIFGQDGMRGIKSLKRNINYCEWELL